MHAWMYMLDILSNIEALILQVLLLERFGSANAQLSNYESLLEKAQQWGLLLRTSASWAMQVSEHTSRQPNRIATMAATLARVQHATGQLEH